MTGTEDHAHLPAPRGPRPEETCASGVGPSGLSMELHELLIHGLLLAPEELAPHVRLADAGLASLDLVEISDSLARSHDIVCRPDQLATATTLADLDALIARHDPHAPAVFGLAGSAGPGRGSGRGGGVTEHGPTAPPSRPADPHREHP